MRTRSTDKQELVRQQAMKMAVTHGLEGFSMNKLAKACDISVATLYIYYKDKHDLITQIAIEEGKKMNATTLKDFDPDMHFEEGLKVQWKNRAKYVIENPVSSRFFEQLRTSTYEEKVINAIIGDFKEAKMRFTKNAVERGELSKMPMEVYWCVAFSPLYALLRFHNEGVSMGGKKFIMNEKILWQAFDLVIKALTPTK